MLIVEQGRAARRTGHGSPTRSSAASSTGSTSRSSESPAARPRPSISKVLERAAIARTEEVVAGLELVRRGMGGALMATVVRMPAALAGVTEGAIQTWMVEGGRHRRGRSAARRDRDREGRRRVRVGGRRHRRAAAGRTGRQRRRGRADRGDPGAPARATTPSPRRWPRRASPPHPSRRDRAPAAPEPETAPEPAPARRRPHRLLRRRMLWWRPRRRTPVARRPRFASPIVRRLARERGHRPERRGRHRPGRPDRAPRPRRLHAASAVDVRRRSRCGAASAHRPPTSSSPAMRRRSRAG